ncbi:MAG: hypothetical protein ACI9FZ_000647 [Bacteroidia bacterium]
MGTGLCVVLGLVEEGSLSVTSMSAYQAYYFARAERTFSGAEVEAIDALSSHIEVSAHSAFVHYHYGDFKHKPLQVLKQWFDVLVYYANWGSQTVAFRFDKDAVDLQRLIAYAVDDILMIEATEDHVVVFAQFDENYGEGGYYDLCDDRGSFYAGYVSLYSAVLRGDDRAIFLLWLKAVEQCGDRECPVPIPAGLNALKSEHRQLAEFIELDLSLIKAAAQINPAPSVELPSPPPRDYAKYLDRLTTEQSKHYLEQLLAEDPQRVRADLIRELRQHIPKSPKPTNAEPQRAITFSEVERQADELRNVHLREAAEKRAVLRRSYFERLECEADAMWNKARELIERKQTKAYEQATEILYALKCLALEKDEEANFFKRAEELVAAYPRQRSLPTRLQAAGVLADDGRAQSLKSSIKQNRWKEAHPTDALFDFDLLHA